MFNKPILSDHLLAAALCAAIVLYLLNQTVAVQILSIVVCGLAIRDFLTKPRRR
jgi:hypothetical protein